MAAYHSASVLPVPPHPDGRNSGGRIFRAFAAGDPSSLTFPLDSDAPSTDTVSPGGMFMEYSIQELSHLSGVTTRTLRWYDQIGLL